MLFHKEKTRYNISVILKPIRKYKDLKFYSSNNGEVSELWYDALIDEDNIYIKDNDRDYKLWKKDEIKLYNRRIRITISGAGESFILENELKKAGLSSF